MGGALVATPLGSIKVKVNKDIYPNSVELEFLTLAYNRFYDIYDEVMQDSFWTLDAWVRYSKIKDAFCIYSEILTYEPIKCEIENIKILRPPMEAEIGSDLFKFIRNVVHHFPFYESWDEVWISKRLANWNKEGQSIDKFLIKYENHSEIKYRFWESDKKRMTYLTISFPNNIEDSTKVFLKSILSENEGVKFSIILMKQIIDTQIEK